MLELVHVIVEVGGVGDHLVLVHLLGVHLGVDALAPVRAREAVGRGQLLAVDLVHEERLAAVYLVERHGALGRAVGAHDAHAVDVGVVGVTARALDEPAHGYAGDLHVAHRSGAGAVPVAHFLRHLRHGDAGRLGLFHEIGQKRGVGAVHLAVHRDGPAVEQALGHGRVGVLGAGAHAVVQAVPGVHVEHVLLRHRGFLVDGEVALDVLDLRHAAQALELGLVPQRHALAIVGGVVAGVAISLVLVLELTVGLQAVMDVVDERAELVLRGDVARRVRVAEQALVHRHLGVERRAVRRGVHGLREVLQRRVEVGVAAVAAAVVVVQPVDVVRRLALAGALGELARGALHDLAARQRAQLGRPLVHVGVPHVVHAVEVVLARVGVERDAVVYRALLAVDDRLLLVGVLVPLRLRGLLVARRKRLVRLGSAAGDADRPQQGAHGDQRDLALCVHRSPSSPVLVRAAAERPAGSPARRAW